MKNKEIRELTTEEITKKIEEYKEELFNLRLSQATGSLEKPSRIKELRKLVARMKTILRERELKGNQEGFSIKENKNRELLGTVVSDKNDKTITVLVETYKTDNLYKKRVKYSKKYTAHDEKNEAKVGDKVRIVETRPLSKMKRYRLVQIVEKAIIL